MRMPHKNKTPHKYFIYKTLEELQSDSNQPLTDHKPSDKPDL